MCNEKAKKMRYVLKIGQLTTTYDNFDDFVEALREEAETANSIGISTSASKSPIYCNVG